MLFMSRWRDLFSNDDIGHHEHDDSGKNNRNDNGDDNDKKYHIIVQTMVREQFEDLAEKMHVAEMFWMP